VVAGTSGGSNIRCSLRSAARCAPTVLSDHNSASIPMTTAVVTALTSATWVSYGYFVADDPIVWIAAGSGLLSALVQVGAHLLYPDVAVVAEAALPTALTSLGG